jgi:hypothetical protein
MDLVIPLAHGGRKVGSCGQQIRQERAAQRVAVVEEERGTLRRLGPQRADQRRRLREAGGRLRAVVVIVIGQQMDVEIARGQHAQPNRHPGTLTSRHSAFPSAE